MIQRLSQERERDGGRYPWWSQTRNCWSVALITDNLEILTQCQDPKPCRHWLCNCYWFRFINIWLNKKLMMGTEKPNDKSNEEQPWRMMSRHLHFRLQRARKCSTYWIIDKNSCHQPVPGTLQDFLTEAAQPLSDMGALLFLFNGWGVQGQARSGCFSEVPVIGAGTPAYIRVIPKPVVCADLGETAPPSRKLRLSQMSPCLDLRRWGAASSEVRGSSQESCVYPRTLGEGCAVKVLDDKGPGSQESHRPHSSVPHSVGHLKKNKSPNIGSPISVSV